MPRLKAALVLLSLATASVPATLAAQSTYGAVPGSLNFVQGQANIDGQPIDTNIATPQPRQLRAGETLATANGTADILLAPGALLRLGHDTTVHMVTADANRTEVQLQQGVANLSANVVRHDDLLLVDTANGQTQILSRGLYTLNAATNTVRVYNGEAYVFPGADTTSDVKPVKLKEGHELILGGERAKPASFDREMADTDLLPWTGPKESQVALADATVRHDGGSGYSDAGYYPGYGFAGDYPLYAGGFGGFGYPYGPYGFYGYPFFGVGFGAGFYGGGLYGGGFYPGGIYRGGIYRGGVGRVPYRGGAVGGPRGGYVGGHGFAGRSFGEVRGGGFSGARGGGFSGGGFHGGGGGGFHGGGGGGHR